MAESIADAARIAALSRATEYRRLAEIRAKLAVMVTNAQPVLPLAGEQTVELKPAQEAAPGCSLSGIGAKATPVLSITFQFL